MILDDIKKNSDNLARQVIAGGEDYVMPYHAGDLEGIGEGEYWVVSVTRRIIPLAVELDEAFSIAAV